jgi:peptidoglycan/xylan/chitin deacetylase (PgdA/CDA1 family)
LLPSEAFGGYLIYSSLRKCFPSYPAIAELLIIRVLRGEEESKYMDIKRLLASSANHFRIFDAYASIRTRLTKSWVAILLYHRVSIKEDKWSFEPLSPEIFERQMEYLSRNFKIVSLDKLVEHIWSEKSFPEKAVVITFDGSYKDNYLYAYPILQKYHVPATIFLTTGYIDSSELFWWDKVGYAVEHTSVKQLNLDELGSYSLQSELDKSRAKSIITERLKKLSEDRKNFLIEKMLHLCHVKIPCDLGKKLILSWKEVREMDKGGIAFGSHSVTHPIMVNMPFESVKNEIIQSKKDIEERLGKEVTAFSYPDGDFNAKIVELVRKSGFTCAVSVSPQKLISPKDSVYQLNRIVAVEDFNKFKAVLCGVWGDLVKIKNRCSSLTTLDRLLLPVEYAVILSVC